MGDEEGGGIATKIPIVHIKDLPYAEHCVKCLLCILTAPSQLHKAFITTPNFK